MLESSPSAAPDLRSGPARHRPGADTARYYRTVSLRYSWHHTRLVAPELSL
jgi:hypothetical protein